MLSLTSSFKSIAAIAICASALSAQVPSGWGLAGSRPADYDCSLDPADNYQGQNTVYLKSKPGITASGFGTMSQYFNAAQYAGKRVRFSANMKSEGIDSHGTDSWAGLWMRVDDSQHSANGNPKVLAFDNMHQVGVDRAIKGTTGWQKYSIVLDVPMEATGIGMGILLTGSGAVWMSGLKVEVVGSEVPVSAVYAPTRPPNDAPTNLGFEK